MARSGERYGPDALAGNWRQPAIVDDALGVADPPAMWRRILGSVDSYADLDTELLGAVERLIDFVTVEPG